MLGLQAVLCKRDHFRAVIIACLLDTAATEQLYQACGRPVADGPHGDSEASLLCHHVLPLCSGINLMPVSACSRMLQAKAAERPPVVRAARRARRSMANPEGFGAAASDPAAGGQPGEAAGGRRRRRARPVAPAAPRLDWGDQEYRASVLAGLPLLSAGAQVGRIEQQGFRVWADDSQASEHESSSRARSIHQAVAAPLHLQLHQVQLTHAVHSVVYKQLRASESCCLCNVVLLICKWYCAGRPRVRQQSRARCGRHRGGQCR